MRGHHVPHTPDARVKMRASHLGKPQPWKYRPTVVVDGETRYRCGTCGAFFPADSFYRNRRSSLGLTSSCKRCHCKTSVRTRDPEKSRVHKRRSEAKRRAQAARSCVRLSTADAAALEAAWGDRCLRCGTTKRLTWDHVVPLAKGGDHALSNLQRLCGPCNFRKHTQTADYRSSAQISWVYDFRRVTP